MKTVEVSESALESLKAMVEKLQSERDELLLICKSVVENGIGISDVKAMRNAIAKCTQTQSICDWQEKMPR